MVKENNKIEEMKYPTIVLAVSILLTLVLGFFVVKPLWNSMRARSKELKNKKEELVALESKLENLKVLKEKEAEIKEKNLKVLAALPQDKDVARLFTQFENIAAASGVSIKSVSEGATQATTTTGSDLVVPVSYSLSAAATNYNGFKTTLVKAAEALRLLSVSDISITNNNGALDLSLAISSYTRREK